VVVVRCLNLAGQLDTRATIPVQDCRPLIDSMCEPSSRQTTTKGMPFFEIKVALSVDGEVTPTQCKDPPMDTTLVWLAIGMALTFFVWRAAL
jgi:hypothetical protein